MGTTDPSLLALSAAHYVKDVVQWSAGLGALAARYPDALVQSHISESHDAVAFVEALHPEVGGRDAQLFHNAGLLNDRVSPGLTRLRYLGSMVSQGALVLSTGGLLITFPLPPHIFLRGQCADGGDAGRVCTCRLPA